LPTKRPYLLFHILGWLGFISFQFALFPHPEKIFTDKESYPYLIDQLIINGITILFFYFHHYLLLPKFYFEKKKFIYFLMFLLYLNVSIFIVLAIHHDAPTAIPTNTQGIPEFSENPLAPPILIKEQQHIKVLSDKFLLMGNFLLKMILVFLLSVGIRVYGRWQTAEEEKYKAELSFLKAQINPHFLFNTLNGIYVLAIKKSENTAPAIMKLSSIMRFVISEAHQNFVSTENELKYISDYIDLQKMRLSNNIKIDFVIDAPNKNHKIAPLVLMPFIENAFKHGISTEENCVVKIHIKIVLETLDLLVENKKYKQSLKEEEKSGIGINNTKQRMEVLYPLKHELYISDGETQHIVKLKLNLT